MVQLIFFFTTLLGGLLWRHSQFFFHHSVGGLLRWCHWFSFSQLHQRFAPTVQSILCMYLHQSHLGTNGATNFFFTTPLGGLLWQHNQFFFSPLHWGFAPTVSPIFFSQLCQGFALTMESILYISLSESFFLARFVLMVQLTFFFTTPSEWFVNIMKASHLEVEGVRLHVSVDKTYW